jgi:hypothetical protein
LTKLIWISLALLWVAPLDAQTERRRLGAISSSAVQTPDAVNSGENTSGSTLVFTIAPTASNATVYIATYTYNSGGSNVASIDVKGQTATAIYQYPTGQDRVELWCAKGVSSGSGNITITKGNSGDECAAAALAVLNVNQTTPNGSESHNQVTDAAPTLTVTSATGELVVVCVGYYNKNLTVNGTGETLRIDNYNSSAQGSIAIITKAGATSTVFDDDFDGTTTWTMIGVPAKPL